MGESHRGKADRDQRDGCTQDDGGRGKNSHKEMKIKGGITGRRDACSDSQAIREVGVKGGTRVLESRNSPFSASEMYVPHQNNTHSL